MTNQATTLKHNLKKASPLDYIEHQINSESSFKSTIANLLNSHVSRIQKKIPVDAAPEHLELSINDFKDSDRSSSDIYEDCDIGKNQPKKLLKSVPWLQENTRITDFFNSLHVEICTLVQWLNPLREEKIIRQRILGRVSLIAESLWPQCKVTSFGSYYTGLWLPNGDMDICLMNVPGDEISNLCTLALCISKLGTSLAVEVLFSARVPIVKYIDSESGILVDITLNSDSALSTSNFILQQLQLYPWLRPLILTLKLYLQQRNLSDTYCGGVGSYLLFVLCLSFIQQHKITTATKFMKTINLGHLLYDFFQLYGRDFNIDTTAISVNDDGSYCSKVFSGWFTPKEPFLLAVGSPLKPHVNLGKNSYDIQSVRNCFYQSFLILSELLYRWNNFQYRPDSILKYILTDKDALMNYRIHRLEKSEHEVDDTLLDYRFQATQDVNKLNSTLDKECSP